MRIQAITGHITKRCQAWPEGWFIPRDVDARKSRSLTRYAGFGMTMVGLGREAKAVVGCGQTADFSLCFGMTAH